MNFKYIFQKQDSNVTTLEPSITIVRGEADGTTTYYKIISTSQPGASMLPIHGGGTGSEANAGKVQVENTRRNDNNVKLLTDVLICRFLTS